jgi:two-component system sensor histidine kinase DevS
LLKDNPKYAGQRIEQAINDLNTSIRDIRSYILGLRPRQLLNENLMKGIQRLISEFRINTLVNINLKGSWEDLVDIPETQAVALFHICQEALANIAKHAQAHQVSVQVWTTTDRAYLELNDDGKGFNPNKIKMSLGHGLANMQTRAYNAGGDVEFISSPGEGTKIITWVPFVNEKYTYE